MKITSWRFALMAVGIVSFAALIGYLTLREARGPASAQTAARSAMPRSGAGAPGDSNPHGGFESQAMRSKVDALARRLEENPDEGVQSWITLARSYFMQGHYSQSAEAYAAAVARLPHDAQLLADYAEALALAHGRSLQGEPEKIVHRALAIDPKNIKALGMAGRAAFDRADYENALRHWDRLLPLLPPGSEFARKLKHSIADAKARMSNLDPEFRMAVRGADGVSAPENSR